MTWPSGDPNRPHGAPPAYGSPAYGAPAYGAPGYGPPGYGPPGYGPPPPPPLPYQQHGQSLPPKKSRKGLIIVLSVVVALVVVGAAVAIAAAVFFKDRVVATDVALGSCIADVPDSSRVVTLPTVDCSQPHGGEVYAVLTMPDGDYPGTSVIGEWQSKCPDALPGYVGSANVDSTVGVYVLYPTQETWDAGDRVVTCIATLDPKRTGSLKQ